jgi:hypothetical protein
MLLMQLTVCEDEMTSHDSNSSGADEFRTHDPWLVQ